MRPRGHWRGKGVEIGRLTETDLPALAGLYKQFWGEDSCLDKMRATFRRLKDRPDYIFLAAKTQGRLVGSVLGIVCEELYGDCIPFMVVEDVIVDAEWRRKGIGSALMRELESLAVERNCGYVIFVTEAERTDAQRFYESIAYKPDAYRGFKKRLHKPAL
jgi:ribosomal protein S18 acetylase RimI-like enzyme